MISNRGIAFRVDESWTVAATLDETGTKRSVGSESRSDFITFAEAKALLEDPAAAETRARDVLKTNSLDPVTLFVLGAALARQQRNEAARAILEPLTQSQPQMAPAWRELGFVREKLGERESATEALLKAFDFDPMDKDVLFALGDLLPLGDPPDDPSLAEAEAALRDGRFEAAESLLRKATENRPNDAWAVKLSADILQRRRRWSEAGALYAQSLTLAPDFLSARFRYVTMLLALRKFEEALAQFQDLLKAKPACKLFCTLRATALAGQGQAEAAIVAFETFMEECTDKPGLWLEYARTLRSKRDPKAAAALKRAMRILPSFVDAYMLYASIKPFRWDEAMIGAVRAQLARPDLAPEDRAQLHSALGKAYEDLENYAESFENYRKCNEILRHGGNRSAEMSTNFVRRTITIFNPTLLRRRAGGGCPAHDPIFIVGMKRSGSTLVEQILSRHSAIEALGELEYLTEIIGWRRGYPQVLKELGPESFRAMGEEYMALARQRRKLGKPFFTDKLPHNFGRTGLIHLILPNAKIIDVRRHPLDCGLSCYKHYFPGAQISLSLGDFAGGYVDYVRLMAHFDKVLPGKVHRIYYERLVGDIEHEIRRLLDYLCLPFEEVCLRFHEETRHVETPSADQVRTPLYKTAVEYWRRYEPWLGPMKEKLGYVLDIYPEVPKFYEALSVRMRNPLGLGQTGKHFAVVRGLGQPDIWIA